MNQKITNSELLDGVAVFVAVINAGSFTAAAKDLGHSTSYVSKEISRLEHRLGSRLLNRTTRTLSLTDAGRAYYERSSQLVIDAENAERSINHLQDTPRGLLRVNAPMSFGSKYLLDVLPLFIKRYPEINMEVEFNDRKIDVVSEGFDVVIRAGHIKDSSLVARKFSQSRLVVVAAPSYLQENGKPQSIEELEKHECITYSLIPTPSQWEFYKDGNRSSVSIKPRAICNNGSIQLAMAKQGVGITKLPLFMCEEEVSTGELEVILDNYDQPEINVYVVYPHRQFLAAKVSAFVDFIVESFK